MAVNWAVWQAWNEQRNDICDPNGVHILDEDCKHGCSDPKNVGNVSVLRRGPVSFKRCNIFFCPHGIKVNRRAKAIEEGETSWS